MIENETIISKECEVAEKLNNFFIKTVEDLEIEPYADENTTPGTANIEEILRKYNDHPSIIKIRETVGEGNNFYCKDLTSLDIEKEIHITK